MNEQIKAARDCALRLLKSERKDLEHGLELHRQSVVCDAFCLGICAAVDGDAIKQMIDEGASGEQVREKVSEMTVTRWASDLEQTAELQEALQESGITFWLQNVEYGLIGMFSLTQIHRLSHFVHLTDRIPGILSRVRTLSDISAAQAEGRHCLAFSLNHVPLLGEFASKEEELSYIQIFRYLGVRMMHLTYNRSNMIGCGCYEENDGGLTEFGRRAIKEMNRAGVLVDVAHSGWKTSLEAAKESASPMVASHTACHALQAHPRCKPDEVIQAIADTGGFIGITCVPQFLGGEGNIVALLDHIEHAARKFGADHVAIGTDISYLGMHAKRESAKFPRPSQHFRFAESFEQGVSTPTDLPETEEQMLSLSLTNWPLFTVGLVQRGFSDEEIQRIIGGNVIRVLEAVDSGAETAIT